MEKIKAKVPPDFVTNPDVIIELDQMVKQYNSIPNDNNLMKQNYFWECHSKICKFYLHGDVFLCSGNHDLAYLKTLIENDGPEYSLTLCFCAGGSNWYKIGVCVRGTPLLYKL